MKWFCTVCGYIHEGPEPPAICPVCKVTREKFTAYVGERSFEEEHTLGATASDSAVSDRIRDLLHAGTLSPGLYLAMARAADREGYPEVAQALSRVALEESRHAAYLYELLGEGLSSSTRENLLALADAVEVKAREKKGGSDLAQKAGLSDISAILLDQSRDHARHGRIFEGLLDRYFS